MRVTGRVAVWAILDEHSLDALAGNVGQLVLLDERYLDVLLLRRICDGPTERQRGDKQKTKHEFHGALPLDPECSIGLSHASSGAGRRALSGGGARRPEGTSVRPAMGPPNRVSPLRGPASARSVARLPPADVGGDQTLITHSSRVLAFNNGLGTMGSLIPSSLKATRMRPTWIASTHAMPASISIISGDLRCAASDT
jgi:hypothetical protein